MQRADSNHVREQDIMIQRVNCTRPVRALLLSLLALHPFIASTVASAASSRIVIEFGNGVEVGTNSGDSWATTSAACGNDTTTVGNSLALSCGVSFVSGGLPVTPAVNLGFFVNIGGTLYDTFYINRNGLITFGSALPDQTFAFQSNMTELTAFVTQNGTVIRPFIAALYANLQLPDTTAPGDIALSSGNNGGVNYFRGVADPIGDPVSDPYSITDAVPAAAVTWLKRDENFSEVIGTQLVIYKKGTAGDFYLSIRYGRGSAAAYDISATSSLPGVAGFSLGASTLSFAGPLPEAAGHFYSFRNGSLDTGAPADADSDGIADTADNCPNIANPGQANLDGDALGDACDSDLDGDGAGNTTDNCPAIANASQLDSDGDHLGNACDTDLDGDGIANTTDNCPNTANPSQADANHNGVGDACDAAPAPRRCYVDTDNDIDAADILGIIVALTKKAASSTDPRDADASGRITLADAAICTQRCSRWFCAVR
jgi:hypothetical protein